jgi:hypothetical protein
MNKVICDKCRGDVKADSRGHTPSVKIGTGELRQLAVFYEYDLCAECYKRATEWLVTHPAAEPF